MNQLIGVTGFWLFVILMTIIVLMAIAYARKEQCMTNRREASLSEIEQSPIGQIRQYGVKGDPNLRNKNDVNRTSQEH